VLQKAKKGLEFNNLERRLHPFISSFHPKLSEVTQEKNMSDPSSIEHTSYETTERSLPILPVRDTVLFPHAVLPLTVGRESSVTTDQLAGRRQNHRGGGPA